LEQGENKVQLDRLCFSPTH